MSGFSFKKKNKIKYFTIDRFEDTGVVDHLFTTKDGGMSEGPFTSLNFGLNIGDLTDNIIENFTRISHVLDTSIDKMVLSNQIHETNIRIVKQEDMGKGLIKDRDYNSVDGLVTNIKGIALVTFFADCVPLFFLDPKNKVIGLAHAGWRGTVDKIGGKMLDILIKNFGCELDDILVGIGPSIGPCCYTVNEDVVNRFNTNFTNLNNVIKSTDEDSYHLDLWQANREVLKEKGIKGRNIIISKICTSCNNEILYSYRKENGSTGRMAAIIKLKE
ncbi:peptidoglycan editing factor PgeF [Clostridium sp. D2Q-11]|uniref:Purine nucleoside phosphorylase n=1 Tax=Anaeromonas frigoriresistens TaxID=2683708 RepID=A0A942UVM4_9FIRM|nr:peptidoglycan editing factor PgeF [Anaeromonas frigoriresistens]MBS4540074.1 peptidoglycan editing factor PgeF [Anaeromonas frigoriresistens]